MMQVDRMFHWIITALHYFNPAIKKNPTTIQICDTFARTIFMKYLALKTRKNAPKSAQTVLKQLRYYYNKNRMINVYIDQ